MKTKIGTGYSDGHIEWNLEPGKMYDGPPLHKDKPMNIIHKLQNIPDELWIKWGKNLIKFTAPTLALFFTQLAMGVEPKAAGLVALFALYAALADFFKKMEKFL